MSIHDELHNEIIEIIEPVANLCRLEMLYASRRAGYRFSEDDKVQVLAKWYKITRLELSRGADSYTVDRLIEQAESIVRRSKTEPFFVPSFKTAMQNPDFMADAVEHNFCIISGDPEELSTTLTICNALRQAYQYGLKEIEDVKKGNPHPSEGQKANVAAAKEFAENLAGLFVTLHEKGRSKLQQIADVLNDGGIPTRTGKGKWTPGSVKIVKDRLIELGHLPENEKKKAPKELKP